MPSTPPVPATLTHPAISPTRLRRARAAVSGLFFLNGVLYANLVPRLPEVKDRLDLGNAAYGSALAALPLGALLAGLLAPLLIGRLGSAKVASFGLLLAGALLLGVPLSGEWLALAAVLLLFGGVDSIVDVAQNAHGFRVQRRYGRSIVNAFHGVWSVGAVVGGLAGSVAAGLAVPLTWHLATSAVAASVAALLGYRFLLPGPEHAERHQAEDPPSPSGTARRLGHLAGRAAVLLAALGLLAICGAFVEDAGSSWGALYLRTEAGASAAVGGLAFVALALAMTVGRLTGDRVVDRFGQRRVARAGGAAVAVGLGVALAWPSVPSTLVGFALAGLGVATLVPAVMHAADELPGLPHGVGLTVVSWLLRVGFLISPTLVGLVADLLSLRSALVSVAAAGVVVLVLGRVLRGDAAAAGDQAAPATGPPPRAGAPGAVSPHL